MEKPTLTAEQQAAIDQLTPTQRQTVINLLTNRSMRISSQSRVADPSYTPINTHTNKFPSETGGAGLKFRLFDFLHDRASVPGGWILKGYAPGGSMASRGELEFVTFVPDAAHSWK